MSHRVAPATRRLLLVAAFALAAAYRAHQCTLPPAETTDVLRNVAYGEAFWRFGWEVYDLTPPQIAPDAAWNRLWPANTYDYPAVALLFFAGLARLSTSLVVAKLALSALDLASAVLVRRLTGSWSLALAWFAAPAGIWWVSREGQFESLVALLVLGVLDALRRARPARAGLWLGLAVQAKYVPLALVPVLVTSRRVGRVVAAFAASLLPSLAAWTSSAYVARMFRPGYRPSGFNPFAWDFTSRENFDWMPGWLIAWEAVLTYALLALALFFLLRAARAGLWRDAVSFVPLVLCVVFCKSVGWGEPWYMLLAAPLALAIAPPRARALLFVLALLEGRGTTALFVGPVGFEQWFPMVDHMHGL